MARFGGHALQNLVTAECLDLLRAHKYDTLGGVVFAKVLVFVNLSVLYI